MEGGFFIGGDFMKKSLRFISCFLVLALLSAVAVFSVSAETVYTINPSTMSFSAIGHYNQSAGSEALVPLSYTYSINGGNSGKEKNIVFTPSSSSYSTIHGVSLDWKFSEQLRFSAGDTVTMTFITRYCTNVPRSNYTSNQTVYVEFGNDLHCVAKPVSYRYSTMSTWTTYKAVFTYDDCGGGVDSIAVSVEFSNAYPKVEMTLDEVTVSYVNTVDRVVDGLGDKIDSLPQYQDNFIGSYDVGGSALDGAEQNNMNAAADGLNGAKGFFNGMLDNISAYGSAFSVISLMMSKLFTNVPSLYAIVNFSVAIGLFALLLGVLLGAVHRSQREDRIRAEKATRQSRRKGGSS